MSNNSFDLQVLVNGNRCKQYHHQSKTFVQANNGSEYALEIKNNTGNRVLAVTSVDSLNVLTGKTTSSNDTGYIIDAYSSQKIKGFRISDTEWALFKFGYKMNGNTYAQSKNDGSEKNCGIIGLRIFEEKQKPIPQIIHTTTYVPEPYPVYPHWPYNPYWNITSNGYYGDGINTYSSCNNSANSALNGDVASDNISYKGMSNNGNNGNNGSVKSKRSAGGGQCATTGLNSVQYCCNSIPKQDFDIGTEFGRREQNKVHNVAFEKGCLLESFDIYYASRESLINMGVPLQNKLQSNLPQSFPGNYCEPPKNWRG